MFSCFLNHESRCVGTNEHEYSATVGKIAASYRSLSDQIWLPVLWTLFMCQSTKPDLPAAPGDFGAEYQAQTKTPATGCGG
jgi:hypothetical protein